MAEFTLPYAPLPGRSFVTLVSYGGPDIYGTTPVADGQIDYPDALTMATDGTFTGPDGNYNLYYIAPNGMMYGAAFEITSPDVTAPILTNPTATATSDTTADASVSTDEDNGPLFYLATANASELAADVISLGESQPVTEIGVQNVSIAGLTAETAYYVHFVHQDAAGNNSDVVSSAQFTTDAAPAEPGGATDVTFTRPYGPGPGWDYVTLIEGFDNYLFADWETQPVVGSQIEYQNQYLTLNNLGHITSLTDDTQTIQCGLIQADGMHYATTITAGVLQEWGDDSGPPEAVKYGPGYIKFRPHIKPKTTGNYWHAGNHPKTQSRVRMKRQDQ